MLRNRFFVRQKMQRHNVLLSVAQLWSVSVHSFCFMMCVRHIFGLVLVVLHQASHSRSPSAGRQPKWAAWQGNLCNLGLWISRRRSACARQQPSSPNTGDETTELSSAKTRTACISAFSHSPATILLQPTGTDRILPVAASQKDVAENLLAGMTKEPETLECPQAEAVSLNHTPAR